jgi:S-adenosylmethionine-dependent methyltransferase
MTITEDRNFDDLADKFARKVYGELKGDIRLAVIWRDLLAAVPRLEQSKPVRILDVGGGLGQFAVRLARLGHHVFYNDLSGNMLAAAEAHAIEEGVEEKIKWYQGPYQELPDNLLGQFDLILCHAMIEWLAQPDQLILHLKSMLAAEGLLSLTFYNKHSLTYRNLIRGNFKVVQAEFKAYPGSLTPGTPLHPETVLNWAQEANLEILNSTGIRVFHDYVSTPRGGHNDPKAVIDMELEHSQLEPYKWLGRYIHLVAGQVD